MDIIQSSIDECTFYKLEEGFMTIERHGDEMKMDSSRIDELSKVFREDIRQEIQEIAKRLKNAKNCEICGELFFPKSKKSKYCCPECAGIAQKEKMQVINAKRRSEKKKEKPVSHLNELAREARKQGISYGQLQARKYIESIQY